MGESLGGLFVLNFIGLESAQEMPTFFPIFFVCGIFVGCFNKRQPLRSVGNPSAPESKA